MQDGIPPHGTGTFAQRLRQNACLLGSGYVPGRIFDLGDYSGATYQPDSPHRVRGEAMFVKPCPFN